MEKTLREIICEINPILIFPIPGFSFSKLTPDGNYEICTRNVEECSYHLNLSGIPYCKKHGSPLDEDLFIKSS